MSHSTSRIDSASVDFLRVLCLPGGRHLKALSKTDAKNLNWSDIVAYAIKNGLAPSLQRRLVAVSQSAAASPRVGMLSPESLSIFEIDRQDVHWLNESYLSTIRHNLASKAALQELDRSLDGKGIPCIVFKGAALMLQVYPSFGQRPMDDIDLLIPQKHWDQFAGILRRMGYSPRQYYPMTWERNGSILDLHLDLIHTDRIQARKYAAHLAYDDLKAGVIGLNGASNLMTLSSADAVIAVAVHAMKHGFSRDIWIMDLFHLLHQYPDISHNDEGLRRRAVETGTQFPLWLLFRIAADWPRPPGMENGFCRQIPINPLCRRMVDWAVRKKFPLEGLGELGFFFMMKTIRDRLRLLRETVFPSALVMTQLYPNTPENDYIKHYPRRVARLFAQLFSVFR